MPETGGLVAGRFLVEGMAASGGMCTVYRARDVARGTTVALKVLHPHLADERERLVREAQVLAQLEHPGIVRLVDAGAEPDGAAWIAMEWLEGEDLSQRLERGPLELEPALTLLERLAEALAAAHARGVVHRDLKPSNVMLVDGDPARPKLVDFGIARWLARRDPALTATGIVLGTPSYMAPEQASGRPIDARADVFALGSLAYEVLAGEPAFPAFELMAALVKVLFEEPAPLAERRPDAPAALIDLVARMMSKAPGDRPQDGAAVRAELHALDRRPSRRSHPGKAITERERRVVAIVLARPSDSLDLTDTLPVPIPGAAHDRLQALRERLRPFAARIELLADGTLVALVTATGSATDVALAAARAGRVVHEWLPSGRVGIATTTAELRGALVLGDLVERAARLVATGRGAIRVHPDLAPLLATRVELGQDADGLVLLEERPAASATARTPLPAQSGLHGRAADLLALHGWVDEARRTSRARAILVTGPAGIGKSRLVRELVACLDGPEVWTARGDVAFGGAAFGLAGALVRDAAALHGADPSARSARVRERVGRTVEAADQERVARFLCEVAGAPLPEEGNVELRAARADAVLMGDQILRAWLDWLDAECARSPVLLVLEDLHHGDLPSLRLVDAALRSLRDRPLVVLATARDDLGEAFPDLWAGRAVVELPLRELGPDDCADLVRRILGAAATPASVERIVRRSGGNPFLLEELAHAVAAGRSDLPDSVVLAVQARLEALDADDRRVLRAASVFGTAFPEDGVPALLGPRLGPEVHGRLGALENLELVRRRRGARAQWSFQHVIVQEVAYAMSTEADLATGHKLAAEWLERAGEGHPLALAEHFERGGEPGRAVGWYVRAAEQARAGGDLAEVVACADRSIRCGAAGEPAARLERLAAEAEIRRGDFSEAFRRAGRALEMCEPGGAVWVESIPLFGSAAFRLRRADVLEPFAKDLVRRKVSPELEDARTGAVSLVAGALLLSGRPDDALALMADLPPPEAIVDLRARARRSELASNCLLHDGDHEGVLLELDRTVACELEFGDLRGAEYHRCVQALALLELGVHARAEGLLRHAIEVADRLGDGGVGAFGRHLLGEALERRGELDEALAIESRAIEELDGQGDEVWAAAARLCRAAIQVRRGAHEDAERDARVAVERLTPVVLYRHLAHATLAEVLLARGDAAGALAAARTAIGWIPAHRGIELGEGRVRLAFAEALAARGDRTGAADALESARARLIERVDRIRDPELGRSLLADVPAHVRTLQLSSAGAAA